MLSEFYGDVLPPDGHFALWRKSDRHNIWFASQGELLSATQDAIDSGAQGIYFATAGFNETAAQNGDKDARTQANVTGKKSFYLDLDAGAAKLAKHGESKVYATQHDAIADAIRFFKETTLAPTYLISSGEGLHVYWVLDEVAEGAQWTHVAKRLSRLFKQFGLKEDSAVTADSARILRPIGTLHENGTAVKMLTRKGSTYTIDAFSGTLTNLLVDDADELPPPPKLDRRSGINKDVVVEGPPKDIRKIVAKCAAVRAVVSVKGNVEEPYWRAMLGIAKYVKDSDKVAHIFSSGHPDYSKRDTQFKLDNWKTGPTTCDQFANYCSDCSKCEFKGTIKSPIMLGLMNDKEVAALPPEEQPAAAAPPKPTGKPWDGFIPAGFNVKNVGAVPTLFYKMPVEKKDEDGETITSFINVPFTSEIFWCSQWTDAENSDDEARAFLQKWTGKRIAAYSFDQTLIGKPSEFRSFLSSKSIFTFPNPKAQKAMEEYSQAIIKHIREIGEQPRVPGRFGMFITEEGDLNCAHGKYIIDHEGNIKQGITNSGLADVAAMLVIPVPKTGQMAFEPSVWDSHIMPKAKKYADFMRKYYNQPGLEKFQLAAMMGIASPLMPFCTGEYVMGRSLPPSGLTVSLYSLDGGKGKSTLLKAMGLAFGLPGGTVSDRNNSTSTLNGRVIRLGMMGSMPVGMDEMGDIGVTECANLVSTIANGVAKERGTKDGGLRVGTPFSLITVMAANKSAREMITASNATSNAIQYRLLELDVEHVEPFSPEVLDSFKAEWAEVADTAGALGAVLHKLICSMSVSAINANVLRAVTIAGNRIEGRQTDRFQHRGLGALIVAHKLLQTVGLDMFDLETMIETCKQASHLGQSYTVENTLPTGGLDLLGMALHDLTANTAITKSYTRRTRHVSTYDEPLVQVPTVVLARHIVDEAKTYVSAPALRDWCTKHKVSISKIISTAKKDKVLTNVYTSNGNSASTMNLLKGMRGSTESAVSCYAFDIGRLAMLGGRNHVGEIISDADTAQKVIPIRRDEPPSEESGSAVSSQQ